MNAQPVPVGTLVEAFDPQGTQCGEAIVTHAGWYGLLSCYRDDPATPQDEGALPGDTIAFQVGGVGATAVGPGTPLWTSNGDVREVDLVVDVAPVVLSIARNWTDAVLTWSASPSAVSYRVYRNSEPTFVPVAGDIIATPSTPSFTDPGVLGDPAHNVYYLVTAVSGVGVESALSNRVGAFESALVPAAQAGGRAYNLIALTLKVPGVSDADSLAAYVGGVYMVLRHDAATQGIEWRLPGLAGTNFPVELGGAYFLYLDNTAPSVASLVGDVPSTDEVRFALARPEPGGSCAYSFISVPLHRDDLADADALAADIGGVHTVSRYNAETQDLTWRMPGVAGENFAVRAGHPYIVCVDETAPPQWP